MGTNWYKHVEMHRQENRVFWQERVSQESSEREKESGIVDYNA